MRGLSSWTEGIPGAFPAIKGSPVALGDAGDVHIDTIVYGRGGTAMQAFDNQLTEKEIAAVVTYQRNAWGNDTGDVVQLQILTLAKVKQQSGGSESSTDEVQSDAKEQLRVHQSINL